MQNNIQFDIDLRLQHFFNINNDFIFLEYIINLNNYVTKCENIYKLHYKFKT